MVLLPEGATSPDGTLRLTMTISQPSDPFKTDLPSFVHWLYVSESNADFFQKFFHLDTKGRKLNATLEGNCSPKEFQLDVGGRKPNLLLKGICSSELRPLMGH